jgi:hypothetical protein
MSDIEQELGWMKRSPEWPKTVEEVYALIEYHEWHPNAVPENPKLQLIPADLGRELYEALKVEAGRYGGYEQTAKALHRYEREVILDREGKDG